MSLALLFHYIMLNVFRMLINSSSGACDLFVDLFHVLYCSGSMCVGVTVWFGWGGVVWYPNAGCSSFPRTPRPVPLSLYISSPFMTYRTPVSPNRFDLVVPTTAKTLTHFAPSSSSLLGPLVLYCYNVEK